MCVWGGGVRVWGGLCGVWSVECVGVWSEGVECGVWSVECGVCGCVE